MSDTPPATLPAVLAIDGGNSKTDVALVSADGQLLGTARGPGAPPPGVGMDNAMRVLGDLITEAARDAGLLDGKGLAGRDGPVAMHLSACMAGADMPEEEEEISAVLSGRGWAACSVQVRNDTFAVLRAGARRPWGVAVVCGAGINCVGVAPDGRTHRFLALGTSTGDWGGGLGLSTAMMFHAMRAEDGRGLDTMLRRMLPAHFGLASVHDVAVALHLGELGNAELVAATPVLFEAADAGDQTAVDLVDRQAEEIFLMARSALTRLDLLESDTEVVLGGGVLTSRHPLLATGVARRLKAIAPAAVPTYIDAPPVAGAALLGLDRLGSDAETAGARLRAGYALRPAGTLRRADWSVA